MKVKQALLILMLGAALPAVAQAELPSGHYVIPFSQQYGVWDVTGNYSDDDVSTTTSFTLVQDDKGKITGSGSTSGTEQGYNIQLNFTVKGAIKAVAGVTRVDLSTKHTGTATDGGPIYNINGSMKLSFEIEPSSQELRGTAKGNICIKKVGCDSIDDTHDYDLPASQDGTWNLALNVVPASNNKNLTGTATATLSNGRVEPLNLSGQYVSSTDTANLKLKGSAGLVTLRINAAAGQAAVQMINASLLGQKVVGP